MRRPGWDLASAFFGPSRRQIQERSLPDSIHAQTSAQIAEAERLIAEWEPNPSECEFEGAQAEN
jgi:hypothetical protein